MLRRPQQPLLALLAIGLSIAALVMTASADPGDLDLGFAPEANSTIDATCVKVDGKILVGGSFTIVDGQSRIRIARLHANGSLDTNFNTGTGANGRVYSIAIQPDGKILICGEFTTVNFQNRNYIARLNTDGNVDTGFNTGTGANSLVRCLALQEDGKIWSGVSDAVLTQFTLQNPL